MSSGNFGREEVNDLWVQIAIELAGISGKEASNFRQRLNLVPEEEYDYFREMGEAMSIAYIRGTLCGMFGLKPTAPSGDGPMDKEEAVRIYVISLAEASPVSAKAVLMAANKVRSDLTDGMLLSAQELGREKFLEGCRHMARLASVISPALRFTDIWSRDREN